MKKVALEIFGPSVNKIPKNTKGKDIGSRKEILIGKRGSGKHQAKEKGVTSEVKVSGNNKIPDIGDGRKDSRGKGGSPRTESEETHNKVRKEKIYDSIAKHT